MMKTKKRQILGFTLIELLVAMAIFAMMMAVALVAYQGTRKSARDGKRKADVEQIRSALEMYRADEGVYPPGTLSTDSVIASDTGTYLTIPPDPDSDNRKYYYTNLGSGSYAVCASLEIPGSGAADCGGNVCQAGTLNVLCNYEVKNP